MWFVINTQILHEFHTILRAYQKLVLNFASTIRCSGQPRLFKASDLDTKDKGGCDVKNYIPIYKEHSK